MANNNERFTATIEVNARQAHSELDRMTAEYNTKMERLRIVSGKRSKEAKAEAEQLRRDTTMLNKQIQQQKKYVDGLDKAMGGLAGKTYNDLRNEVRQLNKLMRDGTIEKESATWREMAEHIRRCKEEMREYEQAVERQETVWGKFTGFLNKNWGAITQIFGAVTGISATIRSAVNDYATMEEEMANTRKYTGMTAEQVRDLNEAFKDMDTRTSREQLNQLAGSAGRLGITSKQSILDFVDAADKISVALGDDLGENAVDQIGKLAMAFGEDENKGLRGAMLATGSAVNELAQNSAANAGYLVEFTARVAGVGKQLGLTQAQIMGFGAVMDENLLKDEMAATAFGNMLTKMQTDTDKFARIAGKSVGEFTRLMREDANAAVLAVADSLKRQDPTNMMKMLDSMGLDGSRAVGVLSTLADKIDDVRRHQQRATEAYGQATSVQGEFNTMNNTVQARIDKCKKKFKEMTVELGEKLLPVVKYTISGGSAMARMLSVLADFAVRNGKELAVLATQVALLTSMWKAHSIWLAIVEKKNKAVAAGNAALTASMTLLRSAGVALHATWALLTRGVSGYVAVMRAARMASLINPWTALATALTVVGVAIYGVVKAQGALKRAMQEQDPAWRAAKAHAKDMADINGKMNSTVAKEIATVNRLTNVIRSDAFSIDERREAIRQLENIVPGYHASITSEGKLIETATGKLTEYIDKLKKAARAQAYMNKLTELENERLDNEQELSDRQLDLKTVKAEIDRGKRTGEYESRKTTRYTPGTAPGMIGTYREVEMNEKLAKKLEERKLKEAAVNDALKKREEITIRQKKLEEQMRKDGITAVPSGSTKANEDPAAASAAAGFITDKERKKKEKEEKKRLKEQVERAQASYQEQLACEMMSYRQGTITYTDYMEKKHKLTQKYYEALKAIYGKDSTEYRKLLDNREREEAAYYQWKAKRDEQKLTLEKLEREQSIRRKYMQQQAVDSEAMNEALFESDITYLKQKQNLYKKGSKEWEEIEMQIQVQQKQHQFNLEQSWMEKLGQYRQQAGMMDYQKLQEIELKGVKSFYETLLENGQMTKSEYDAIIDHIKRKYAELQGQQAANNDVQKKASEGLSLAKQNAGYKDTASGDNAVTGIYSISQAVEQQKLVNEQLKLLYGEDYENNREYQEAKRQLDAETMQQIVAGAQAAYSSINSLMSAASTYAQACSEVETAKVTADYDRQIAAAGKNSKKAAELEEEKQKKIADMKTKANRKAMQMEIAQATASAAMAAINAYASAVKVPILGPVLGPLAAAAALAAAAIQIAAIKKQHEAQAAGYYEGGFTGGHQYRKEAGVVHEGEFVANHKAVQNPDIMPILNLIDQAQRNNTVGALSMHDVARVMGTAASAQVVAPIVNVENDNEELRAELARMHDVGERLLGKLDEPIDVQLPMQQLDRSYKRYLRLTEKV